MATITPKLTIASTTASGNEALGLSISKEMNVLASGLSGISQEVAPATADGYKEILAGTAGRKYVYVSHTGKQGDGTSASTKVLSVQIGGHALVDLLAGEFAFFCVADSKAVKVKNGSAGAETIMAEFGVWSQQVAGN